MESCKQSRLLFVDDDPIALEIARSQFEGGEHELFTAPGPTEAISLLLKQEVAVVVSDYVMPVINGLELVALVRQYWPSTVCILMSAYDDVRRATAAIDRQLVHEVVTKPWKESELRKILHRAVEIHHGRKSGEAEVMPSLALRQQIRRQASKAALSIACAMDARDHHTVYHSQDVAAYCMVVGRAVGLEEDALGELCIGALLHDVGKIGVPDEVLLKPGRLNNTEFEAIKKHPTVGASMVAPIDFPGDVAAIVHQHHENHDGSGYPSGIAGKQIAQLARIIRVADAFEAMSTNRFYQHALRPKRIVEEFMRYRGSKFDPNVVDVFLDEMESGRMTSSRPVQPPGFR